MRRISLLILLLWVFSFTLKAATANFSITSVTLSGGTPTPVTSSNINTITRQCFAFQTTLQDQSTGTYAYAVWTLLVATNSQCTGPFGTWQTVGGPSNGPGGTATFNVNATGVYSVRLDLYDASNQLLNSTTQNCIFQIFPKPSISSVVAAPNPQCGGGPVNYTAAVSGGTTASATCSWTYQWSFNGGTPSSFTGPNPPTINYSCRTSPYSALLTVTDCNGCYDIYASPSAVSAPCKPTASYTITGNTCNAPANLSLTGSPAGANYSYGWWFPATLPATGAATQTGGTISHNFPTVGCYNVQLGVKDNATGCADTLTQANGLCIEGFSVTSMSLNQSTICSGQSVCCTLHIVNSAGINLTTALFSGVATPTGAGVPTNSTFNYVGNGDYVGCFNLGASATNLTYTISIGTITNSTNNCTITYSPTQTVTVKPAPVAQINMQTPYFDNYCAPSHQFCFTASQPGVNAGGTYDWYLNAGYNPSVGTSPSSYCTTFTGIGQHNIFLKVCINTPAGLCCSFDMDTVYLQKPQFTFVGDTLSTCAPFNTHFTASPFVAATDSIFKWYPTGYPAPPGAGPFTTTTPKFTYTYNSTKDTCYTVVCVMVKKATGTPPYACTDTVTKKQYVKVGHKITPVVHLYPNSVCLDHQTACVQLDDLVGSYKFPLPPNSCPSPSCDWYFTRPKSKIPVFRNTSCDSPKICFTDTGYYDAHYRVCVNNCCDTVHVDSAVVVSGILGTFIDSVHCTVGSVIGSNPTVTFKSNYKIFPRPTSGNVYTQLVINGVPDPVTGLAPYIIYDTINYGTTANPIKPNSFRRHTVNAFPQTGTYNVCFIVSYPQGNCPPDTICKNIQLVPITALIRIVGQNKSTVQCAPATWTFSSAGCSPKNPAQVIWYFSDNPNVPVTYPNPTDTSISHTFNTAGFHTAKLKIMNASGSCIDSTSISLLQVVDYTPAFTLRPQSSGCNACFTLVNNTQYFGGTSYGRCVIDWNYYNHVTPDYMAMPNNFDSVFHCVSNLPASQYSSVIIYMWDTIGRCMKQYQLYYSSNGAVADMTTSVGQDSVICAGTNVTFTSTSKGTIDPTMYVWNVNQGTCNTSKIGTQNANTNPNFANGVSSINYTFGTQGYYNVTLYAANTWCRDSICKTIHVQDPVACFTWKSDTLSCPGLDTLVNCSYGAGDSIAVTMHTNNAGGSGLPFTYYISYSKPLPKKIALPAKLPGIYDITFEFINTKVGCYDSIHRTLTVLGPVGYVTSLQNRVVCAGDPSPVCWYTNSFTAPNIVYCDSFPLSVPYNSSYSYCTTHQFKNPGFCKTQIWIQDANGCSYPMSDTVIVDKPLGGFKWSISGAKGAGVGYCGPVTIQFTDTSRKTVYNLDPLNYNWTFYHGDGTIASTSTLTSPLVTFYPPDTISAQLILASVFGCKDTVYASNVVELHSYPVSSFLQSIDTICRTDCVSFTDQSVSIEPIAQSTWYTNWASHNPMFTNTAVLNHCFNVSGNYLIALVDSTKYGCMDTSLIHGLYVLPDLKAKFTLASDSLCMSSPTAIFTDASIPSSGLNYCWNFGDLYDVNGNIDTTTCQSTQVSPTHLYALNPITANANQFKVRLKISSKFGCMDSTINTVWLFSNPKAQISSSPLVACEPMTTHFMDLSTSGNPIVNYNLVYGDATPDYNSSNAINGSNGDHVYSTAGSYTATYTVTTNTGCDATTTLNFVVNPLPVACAGPDDTICAGDIVSIGCMPVQNYQYNWYDPPGPIYSPNSMSAQPTVHPFLSTTYKLAVVNQFGCADTDEVYIYVWPLISVTAGPDSNICYGQPVTLWANNVGPMIGPFQWHSSHYDVVANTPTLVVNPTHTDLYTVAANGPCNSDSTVVQLSVFLPPPVTLEPSATIVAGQPYSILSVGNGTANWYPNYMITCTDCVNPTVSPEVNTTYHVILTDIHGCIDSAKITVTVLCDRTNAVYVPNAFTPSKPGLNDHFYIQGTGVKEINFLRIYNRWGNLVYNAEHFQINQKDMGWDGRFGGHELSSDVFMYQMQVECANGNVFPISGNFTLIR